MALTITLKDNTIFLEGTLTSATIDNFKNHFGLLQDSFSILTLNFERVSNIDQLAKQTLKQMYSEAILNRNMFFVEGEGCEYIYEDFQYPKVA